MKVEEITEAGVFKGSSHGMGSARMVDRIYSRYGRQVWVDWVSLSSSQPAHRRQGSMTIEAFAQWAQLKEEPTDKDLEAHQTRRTKASRALGIPAGVKV